MGMFGGAKSKNDDMDEHEQRAHVRALENDIQIMKDDLKKLEKELDVARRKKVEDTKTLSKLQTEMREDDEAFEKKEREFETLTQELKQGMKELQNQPRH